MIILGAVLGSFFNVCIYRLPLEKSIIWPGSHCPNCLRPVRPRDNIPILSWFVLGGRCRDCGESFSPRYMLIEVLTAAIFGLLVWSFSPQGAAGWIRYAYFAILCSGLVVATFIDFDHYIIPDSVTVPLMIIGLAAGTVWTNLHLLSITGVLPNFVRIPAGDRWLYAVGIGAGWLLFIAWLAWFWLRCARTTPGWAEWVMLAVWFLYLAFHTVAVFSCPPGQPLPAWIARINRLRGFWTGVVGFLVGAAMIWFVRVLAAGLLNFKRRSVAKRAIKWRRTHSVAERRRRKRIKERLAEQPPGYFDEWKLIFAGTGRITEWKNLGPWIAKEGMGFGDVTLMAAIGSFLGWQAAVLVFFLAPFMGLAVNIFHWLFRGTRQIPYGPYLSAATLVVILFWAWIWPWAAVRVNALLAILAAFL
jgi:prepilin signal peptidase PulO-like enzyme (type II secretory pathway)